MGTRVELQTLLEGLLGSRNVYFQPPASLVMKYPCIRYELSNIDTIFANNSPYKQKKMYKIVVIDQNPDSIIPDKVSELQLCIFDRRYSVNNLNHTVYNLYY